MVLKGSDILAIDDRKTESVIVPDWDGAEVFIRSMSAVERAKYEYKLISLKDAPLDERMWTIKVSLVVMCACNEDMDRLFDDNQFEAVANKSANAIDIVFAAIDRLNLISQQGVEEEAGK